jgi:hypothetical protein
LDVLARAKEIASIPSGASPLTNLSIPCRCPRSPLLLPRASSRMPDDYIGRAGARQARGRCRRRGARRRSFEPPTLSRPSLPPSILPAPMFLSKEKVPLTSAPVRGGSVGARGARRAGGRHRARRANPGGTAARVRRASLQSVIAPPWVAALGRACSGRGADCARVILPPPGGGWGAAAGPRPPQRVRIAFYHPERLRREQKSARQRPLRAARRPRPLFLHP